MITYIFLISERNQQPFKTPCVFDRPIQQEILGVELENTGSQKERIKEAEMRFLDHHLATLPMQLDFFLPQTFLKRNAMTFFQRLFFRKNGRHWDVIGRSWM